MLMNRTIYAGLACSVPFFNLGSLALLLPDDGDGNNAQALGLGGGGSVEKASAGSTGR